MPQKVDLHIEYVEENQYVLKWYSIDETTEIVQKNRGKEM
ncbi:hypothetical protein J2T20_004901 [Paenibacillus wynnii]|nr:hypothetical protein [Paenibacillus wynnii]